MGAKSLGCLYKVLGTICLVGALLILSYTEVMQMLNYSVIHSTLSNYIYNTSFCNIMGNAPFNLPAYEANASIHIPAHQVNTSIGAQAEPPPCNCSGSTNSSAAASPPCPPIVVQQVIVKEDNPVPRQWHADKFWHYPSTFPLCTMDSCFNFSRCAGMQELLIYVYDPPFSPSYYLQELKTSQWHTTNPNEACLFLVTLPSHWDGVRRPHPRDLPHWNGGLNHVISTFADKWSLTGPHPETVGNASVLSSVLHETTYRPGFDISMPLPGKTHFPHLQALKPFERKYFLTFKGLRYLGQTEGSFRSDPNLKKMHNGKDVIISVSCNQVTNNKIKETHPEFGVGCDEDNAEYSKYTFHDLMNTTFGLTPAGRSPSSYRLIETLSSGAIPILICDNYVKPFETLIKWHQCLLQFPTSEIHRILPAVKGLSKEEVERRQRYCLFIYNEYLKDDKTLLRSVIRSLKLRFYGVFSEFNEVLAGRRKR